MTFTARFNTLCPKCETRIHEGDDVRWNAEDAVVHVACRPVPVAEPEAVCPRCFMTLAKNGTCGGCDV